jgi:hypothetical protein
LLLSVYVLLLALLLPGVVLASAFTFTFPVQATLEPDPCRFENVLLAGTAHEEISMTTSSSGNYTMQDTSKVGLNGTAVVSGA